MRFVIQQHTPSTRCERCLPNVLEQHSTCFHVLAEEEDGLEGTTLVFKSATGDVTYNLSAEQVALMRTEGFEAVLNDIEAALTE